jgi:hypothetical protein
MLNMVMLPIWMDFGMINYLPGVIFIVPRLIQLSITRFLSPPDQVMYGADHPTMSMVMGITHNTLWTVLLYLYLVVWNIPHQYGIVGTAWLMELGRIPLFLLFGAIGYTYVHKRIVNIKVPWLQMVLGMGVPSLVAYVAMLGIKFLVWDSVYPLWGLAPAIGVSIPLIFVAIFFLYIPLTVLFGGWDTTNLEELRKSALMSGPSRILVIPIYRIMAKLVPRSKLHNRFAMPIEGVIKEAQELLVIKRDSREALRDRLSHN